MAPGYYDLNVNVDGIDKDGILERIRLAERLGWSGICLVRDYGNDFKEFTGIVESLKNETGVSILCGAMLDEKKGRVQAASRKVLESGADLILVRGGDPEINREASECWEVDILSTPEKVNGRDLMNQRDSGLDHVIARYMNERRIALEVNFSTILATYGMFRANHIARLGQNIMLARKYDVPVVITSGGDYFSMRSPRDLTSLGCSLGMEEGMAKRSVSGNPQGVIEKAGRRKDPNMILNGLEVLSWGDVTPGKKRMFGWY